MEVVVDVEETKLWLLLDLLSSTRAQSVRLISRCSFERKGDDARAPLFAFQKLCAWPGLGLTSRKWNFEATHVHILSALLPTSMHLYTCMKTAVDTAR